MASVPMEVMIATYISPGAARQRIESPSHWASLENGGEPVTGLIRLILEWLQTPASPASRSAARAAQ